jgi:hypothetical protein
MPRAHVIEAGDWLGELAERYGVGHWSHIWNDPANVELRERRGSPDLVMIGDVVQIPDAPPREVEVPAGRRAVFVVSSSPAVLRIRISALGRFVEFFGPVEYELVAGDASISGTIVDDDQILEVPLHATVRSAVLTLMGRERFELDIGGLGPASEHRGALARFESLGFAVDVAPSTGDSEKVQVVDPARAALLAFQSRMGLARTGELDEPTHRALTDMYGA